MAGQVQPKKLFHGLNPDIMAIFMLSKLKTRNAETIFGAAVAEIEKMGAEVLDARCFMDDDVATAGNMTGIKLKIKRAYLEHGIKVARGISELDIGQSVIVRKGTVLAVEDFSGTDDMIKRASKFKTDDAFLVKTGKRRQDYRFDVPIFGSRTLKLMIESGISSVILEAESVIILDKQNAMALAGKSKISVYGFQN
jgi:DUF1009 family protein